MAKPTGSRPTPRVARGAKTSRFSGPNRSYGGSRATKTPTGSRPTPQVARNTPRMPGPGPKSKPAVPYTRMPTSRQYPHLNNSRPHGGGSY